MSLSIQARRRIVDKYTSESTVTVDPAILNRIIDDVVAASAEAPSGGVRSPFAAPWLDSFLAHWTVGQNVDLTPGSEGAAEEAAATLRALVDAKFQERLAEIRAFIRRLHAEDPDGGVPPPPPDGGPPEPGPRPSPAPAAAFLATESPDGGPPEPGTPPTGPDAGFLADNPWILYWFISLRAPMLLDVIDAHVTRRLEELGAETR
jgi:hypothetical protein